MEVIKRIKINAEANYHKHECLEIAAEKEGGGRGGGGGYVTPVIGNMKENRVSRLNIMFRKYLKKKLGKCKCVCKWACAGEVSVRFVLFRSDSRSVFRGPGASLGAILRFNYSREGIWDERKLIFHLVIA